MGGWWGWAKGSEEISTDAANLIRRMEANTAQAVYRDAAGNVFSLHIYLGFASDTNLALVSEIKSLTNITLRTSSINNHSPQQGLRSCRKCQTLLAWALNAPTLCLMGFWLQAVNSNRYGSFVLGQLSRL